MSATVGQPISNIAVAFAGKSASLDIPKPRDGAYPGTGYPPPSGHGAMLPTPPNSISPTLPPHKVRSPSLHGAGASNQIDSDIDLQDAVEHAQAQGHPQALSSAALSGLEAAGAITPSMLAKHHLPDILLANGPIAIRHVLGHLTQTVPGFSRIPPAKARRIVVSALEGRAGGGVNGDVLFEKVGWGRWDARLKGQPPREGRGGQPVRGSSQEGSHAVLSPPASYSGSYALSSAGLQIPGSFKQHRDRRRDYSGASWAGESILSSREEEMEDMNMAEHEADKMSLDGRDDSGASSMAPEDPMDMPIGDDPDDETDEEDWARIGPVALSKGTVPRASARGGRRPSRNYNHLSLPSKAVRMKPTPSLMKAVPSGQRNQSFLANQLQRGGRASAGGAGGTAQSFSSCGFSLGMQMRGVQDAQEREAVEALLRMGSM